MRNTENIIKVKKKGSILEISSKLPQLEFKEREHFRGNWVQMAVKSHLLGWETVLHESFIALHILEAEALMAFALDSIFKDVCVANNLRRQT